MKRMGKLWAQSDNHGRDSSVYWAVSTCEQAKERVETSWPNYTKKFKKNDPVENGICNLDKDKDNKTRLRRDRLGNVRRNFDEENVQAMVQLGNSSRDLNGRVFNVSRTMSAYKQAKERVKAG